MPSSRLPLGQCFRISVTFPRKSRTTFSGSLADETPTSCVITVSGVITGR